MEEFLEQKAAVNQRVQAVRKDLFCARFCEKELQACRIFEFLREPGLLFRF